MGNRGSPQLLSLRNYLSNEVREPPVVIARVIEERLCALSAHEVADEFRPYLAMRCLRPGTQCYVGSYGSKVEACSPASARRAGSLSAVAISCRRARTGALFWSDTE